MRFSSQKLSKVLRKKIWTKNYESTQKKKKTWGGQNSKVELHHPQLTLLSVLSATKEHLEVKYVVVVDMNSGKQTKYLLRFLCTLQ